MRFVLGFCKNTPEGPTPNPFLAREEYKLQKNSKDVLSRFQNERHLDIPTHAPLGINAACGGGKTNSSAHSLLSAHPLVTDCLFFSVHFVHIRKSVFTDGGALYFLHWGSQCDFIESIWVSPSKCLIWDAINQPCLRCWSASSWTSCLPLDFAGPMGELQVCSPKRWGVAAEQQRV